MAQRGKGLHTTYFQRQGYVDEGAIKGEHLGYHLAICEHRPKSEERLTHLDHPLKSEQDFTSFIAKCTA
jgi:hypothetical protein